jgi:hypothetical protein
MTCCWFLAVTIAVASLTPSLLAFERPPANAIPLEHSDTDGFVDSKLCIGCHADIYRRYRETGMARSFYRPSRDNTVGNSVGPIKYYHEKARAFYSMIERDGQYYQRRWRVGFDGSETDIDESSIDFVLGSGNHARSYLHRKSNGSFVELPLAWYSEKNGYWALNPGFDT